MIAHYGPHELYTGIAAIIAAVVIFALAWRKR